MNRIACVVLLVAGAAACKTKPASTVGNQGNALALEWTAVQAEAEHVDVTLLVGGEAVPLGKLSAASDDGPGTPERCSVGDKPTPTAVEFRCGMTPAYNYFRAELVGKELVITHVSGVDTAADPAAKPEIKEVKRMPVKGGALSVAPYGTPAATPPAPAPAPEAPPAA